MLIQSLIYLHAGLGGLALLAGSVALATRKGSRPHIRAGRVFFYCMLASALLALGISLAPGHQNLFLFVVGLFSSYLILTGFRIFQIQGEQVPWGDRLLSGGMLLTGLTMLGWGSYLVFLGNSTGWILIVFGGIGGLMAGGDLRRHRRGLPQGKERVAYHLTRMLGGYIAAWTAFIVVNQAIPGIWGWLAPTVVGTLAIIWFQRRLKAGKLD